MPFLLHMHESIFAASDETLRTVQVLYFRSRTWIIERSSQQCVLHSLSADLSAQRERNAWRVSVMSDHELLLECWRAAWCSMRAPESQLLAAAQAIVICVCCCLRGRHLAAASSNLPRLHRVHPQQVCNWISHMSHSQLNCVFCKVPVYPEKCLLDMLDSYREMTFFSCSARLQMLK